MSRRILIVEPDPAGRAMMDRVLAAEGYAAEPVASIRDARALLEAGAIELAVVDELAGRAGVLEEIRSLRALHPTVPVIATGALLSQRVMQELLRLRVLDALAKPFTPGELREAVARGLERSAARHDDGLEYAAAVSAARRSISRGDLACARQALCRAQAQSPLDAEITALWALVAELTGRDDEADGGYRAALALRREEDLPPPDPHEGLARLGAYAGARPVPRLPPDRAGVRVWLVSDPCAELRGPSPEAAPLVVVLALGLCVDGPGTIYFRAGGQSHAFALLSGAMRNEPTAAALARLGAVSIFTSAPTRERIDVARIQALLAAAL